MRLLLNVTDGEHCSHARWQGPTKEGHGSDRPGPVRPVAKWAIVTAVTTKATFCSTELH